MAFIKCTGLSRTFGTGDAACHALRNVTFEADSGELIAICGASGAGKTTLFHILAGMDTDYEGSCFVAGKEMKQLNDEKRCRLRRSVIGIIEQDYNLLPFLTVQENTECIVRIDSKKPESQKALQALGIYNKRSCFPHELSGGEKQRVAIARLLMQNPQIVLADEPTGNLDQASGKIVMELLQGLAERGCLVLLITHDAALAGQCSRILMIYDGVLYEQQPEVS